MVYIALKTVTLSTEEARDLDFLPFYQLPLTEEEEFLARLHIQDLWVKVKVKVKFICIAHFMYKTIQSALHKIKALQQGAEKALTYVKEYK